MTTPKQRPDQLDSPVVAALIKYGARVQTWVFRRTRGRIGSTWRIGAGLRKPVPTLLLDHCGRRSGRWYTTPLLYLAEGGRLVVVASQGGLPGNPQWYYNLRQHPETTVRTRSGPRHVRARVADAGERASLWPKLVELYADFDTYQSWTEREIPVIVLDPRETDGRAGA